MAKKKRRVCGGSQASAEASGVIAGRIISSDAPGNTVAASPGLTIADPSLLTETDVDLVVRAVTQLSGTLHDECDVLAQAVRPLILARAAKYEEDERAAKLAAAASNTKARQGASASMPAATGKRPLGLPTGVPDDPLLEEEIEEAAQVLQALASKPDVMLSKIWKPLRAALHPLVEAHVREEKASPTFRITSALGQRSRWPEALQLLRKMRELDVCERPKIGAYQRWVREVNAAQGSTSELAMLDAIMRLAVGLPMASVPPRVEGSMRCVEAFLPILEEHDVCAKVPLDTSCVKEPAFADGTSGGETKHVSMVNKLSSLITCRKEEAAASKAVVPGIFPVIAHENALDRKPPNRFDLDIFTCAPPALAFTSPPQRLCMKHMVPGVEGAFVLSSVLSSAECSLVRELTESIGYRPDLPLSSPLDERAQNIVLLASDEQNESLFARVKNLLPQELGGHSLLGLNRRWRIYRYNEGNHYRKHLDGAWPASGTRIGPNSRDEYVYDAYGGSARSKFTFIIYLNDDFDGGGTTFFVPEPGADGTLASRPVRPQAGFATVFPHGDNGVLLLHEGSPVLRGTKYLLRTDVVYQAPTSCKENQEAKRVRGLVRQLGIDVTLQGAGSDSQIANDEAVKVTKVRKLVKKFGLKRSKEQAQDASFDPANASRIKFGRKKMRQEETTEAKRKRQSRPKKSVSCHSNRRPRK